MQPGARFPTELALCREFGVSRETVREALRALEQHGLISRQAGRGSFVLRHPPHHGERRLTGMVEDFSDLKLDTTAIVLEAGVIPLSPDIAEAVGLAPGEPIFRIARLRRFEDRPLATHDAYLPTAVGERLVQLDLRRTSLIHELNQTLGIASWEEYQRVEAVVADTGLARLLEVQLGAPLLHVTRLLRDGDDRLLVLFRSHFRADRYFYTVDLTGGRKRSRRKRAP